MHVPESPPIVRDAAIADAGPVAALLGQLGYPVDVETAEERLRGLLAPGAPDRVIVATVDGSVVAFASLHVTPVLHRPNPVGRVTALVVDDLHRGGGVGRALMDRAEEILRGLGCSQIELTSAGHRQGAHRFYEKLGYTERRARFFKELD